MCVCVCVCACACVCVCVRVCVCVCVCERERKREREREKLNCYCFLKQETLLTIPLVHPAVKWDLVLTGKVNAQISMSSIMMSRFRVPLP